MSRRDSRAVKSKHHAAQPIPARPATAALPRPATAALPRPATAALPNETTSATRSRGWVSARPRHISTRGQQSGQQKNGRGQVSRRDSRAARSKHHAAQPIPASPAAAALPNGTASATIGKDGSAQEHSTFQRAVLVRVRRRHSPSARSKHHAAQPVPAKPAAAALPKETASTTRAEDG